MSDFYPGHEFAVDAPGSDGTVMAGCTCTPTKIEYVGGREARDAHAAHVDQVKNTPVALAVPEPPATS